MGDFRITIEACGGHGCERHIKAGERVIGCRRMNCPDCIIRECVERLQRIGCSVAKAELVHWPEGYVHPSCPPGTQSSYKKEGEVRDNLLTGIRHGEFKG
jgi:hypothetical protein